VIAPSGYDAVLFDLDGTLLDTAPEFVAAIGRLREERGLEPLAAAVVRAAVSQGGAAMLRAAFPGWDESDRALLDRFLSLYRERIGADTVLFPGVDDVLARLEHGAVPWGIVTNKPRWLTEPLLERLGLAGRPRVVVCGDTLARRKPDPDPVLHACAVLGVAPARAVLVGDDERDVAAARAAGAIAVVADWGYSDPGEDAWGATHRAPDAGALIDLLGLRPVAA
jgi:phosphoglycolate phosphatase